jgi:hypothetical protein
MRKTLNQLLEQMGPGGKHEHDALLMLTNEVTGEKRYIWGKGLSKPSLFSRIFRGIILSPLSLILGIVTTAGNVWFAQKSCGQVPTNDFDSLYLATACSEGGGVPIVTSNYGSFTVVAGSEKHVTATYPQSPDADADNTGDGATIASWKFEYVVADGPFAAITHSFIAKTGAGGTDPILDGYKWGAAWAKDASTSAKVFANQAMLGA